VARDRNKALAHFIKCMIIPFIIDLLGSFKLAVYNVPTKNDLDRNLCTILHDAHQKARAEKMRLTSEFAARGMGSSTAPISAAVGVLDGIHKDAVTRSIPILNDFAERMQVAPSEITKIARPHLQNMGNSVLGQLPPAGFPQVHQQILRQYMLVFEQRLDGALRDFEIGFVGGRSVVANPSYSPDRRALLILFAP
jgi:hypothetical protein